MADVIRKKERKNWFYSYNMIFDQSVSEHAKIIYLYLCRCADDEGQSFPSYSTMGKKCGIKSRQTILNSIKELESIGLLAREQRKKEDGGQSSNLYTIYDTPVYQMDTPCPADGHPPVYQMDTPCLPDGHEGLPIEGLPIYNNNSSEITAAIDELAAAHESKYNVVVNDIIPIEKESSSGKSGNDKNLFPENLKVGNQNENPCSQIKDTECDVVEELKNSIEEVTGSSVFEEPLRQILSWPDGEQRIRKAIKNYPAISKAILKTSEIPSPVGLLFYIAKNNILPAKGKKATGLGKYMSFNNFPQHEYKEEDLEHLFENFSK